MKLSNLAGALRKHGLTVVETPGWASRGYAGQDLIEVRGVLWHHTATNRARFEGSPAPTLGMCTTGRPDVPGPLCHIVFGRDGAVYLVAAGLANHAGAGVASGIPRDWGNYYLIGIEMESSGVAPWDWTAAQLRVAPYLGAALEEEFLQRLPAAERLQIAHAEYSSQGKIDPAGWPGGMDGLRASINAVLGGAGGEGLSSLGAITEEDELSAKDVEELKKWNQGLKNDTLDEVWATAAVTHKQNVQLAAKFDALVSALGQAAAGGGVDYAKVEAAATAGAARALADGLKVDVTVEGIKRG